MFLLPQTVSNVWSELYSALLLHASHVTLDCSLSEHDQDKHAPVIRVVLLSMLNMLATGVDLTKRQL